MSDENIKSTETSNLPPSAPPLIKSSGWTRGVAFRLIGLVFILTALILGIILVVFGFRLSAAARQQADQLIEDSAVTLRESFQLWLDGSQSALLNLAEQPAIQSMQPELQAPVLEALAKTHDYMFLVSTVDLDGKTVARSDRAAPGTYTDRAWFKAAASGEQLAYQTQIGSTQGKPILVIGTPIRRIGSGESGVADGEIVGVAMFSAELEQISRIVENLSLGTSGVAYIIDPLNRVVAHSRPEFSNRLDDLSSYPPVVALRQGKIGLRDFSDAAGVEWRAFTANFPGGWGLVVQQTAQESTAALRSDQRLVISLAVFGLLMTLVVIWLAVRRSLQPITELTAAATAITQGNFDRQASVKTKDEFSLLADTFNRMIVEIRDLVQSLEQRVSERTHSLARRTSQLEAAAQVARNAAAIRDLNRLLTETVQLISERFGFYHAGIFIVDDNGEYAVLQAANSTGGQRMLARGHKLRVGQVGIVGYAAGAGRPRIALDVGEDAVFFNNPDLPQTRSEMALPLKVSGKVTGVLDVQSLEPNAFAKEDIEVLQILADQIALAIESARRLQESQQALTELNAVYGERTRQSWQERLHNQVLTHRYGPASSQPEYASRGAPLQGPAGAGRHSAAAPYEMEIPISLRGQAFGTIRLRRAADQSPWTEEEQELVRDAMVQIAPALENARLLEEIQQRAHHESLVAQFANRVQTSLDLESVLRTAVNEIGSVMDAERVRIRLKTDGEKPEDKGNGS